MNDDIFLNGSVWLLRLFYDIFKHCGFSFVLLNHSFYGLYGGHHLLCRYGLLTISEEL